MNKTNRNKQVKMSQIKVKSLIGYVTIMKMDQDCSYDLKNITDIIYIADIFHNGQPTRDGFKFTK